MPRIFTLSQYTSLRRKLRQQPTTAEAFLWFCLRNKKLLGYKFRRQHSIGRYVLDFFCARLMLGIEVDGVTHLDPTKQEYDKTRQKWIEAQGVRVVRFTDHEILADPDAVLEKLRQLILSSHPSSP
jgi:5-methyltetrahydrofolate--homocysteine methyltransferase